MSTAVSRTVSTCFYQLRRIRTIRRSLPVEAAKTMINAFVVSRIDYGNGLYAGITVRQSERLQLILNASARVLFGGGRYDRVTPLLRDKLHWLRFRQRVTYKLCLLTFNALHQRSPGYIKRLVVLTSTNLHSARLRSADTRVVTVPRVRTKFGERSFSFAGPRAWNSLPAEVRMSPSLDVFKMRLKTELFRMSYNTTV
jgi:hypothetical protein